MHGVEGRVVIVTGSGQGIGLGVVRHLHAGGAQVVVTDWKAHRVERVADELGERCLGVVCDISDRDQIDALVARTVEAFGRIDGLVNNAHTFTPQASLESLTEDDLETNLGTLRGVLWAMQAVRPVMAGAGWGRIVNLASAAAIVGMAGYGAYSASKEAIRALTRTAAREWASDGIVVNAIAPGAASRRGQDAVDRDDALLADHPMGRLGDPELDIAPVVLFLCSDAARYLTGQTLLVDGGMFLWS
jgi:NAD(P)-dependent dehydrogenase (short-subunit alcohol dehydrogenase family)